MSTLKSISVKALQNLHVTLPVGMIISLVCGVIYVTAFAKDYENRLDTVEITVVAHQEQSDRNLKEIKGAVVDMDKKFDQKFDNFQSEMTATVIQLLK